MSPKALLVLAPALRRDADVTDQGCREFEFFGHRSGLGNSSAHGGGLKLETSIRTTRL